MGWWQRRKQSRCDHDRGFWILLGYKWLDGMWCEVYECSHCGIRIVSG